MAVAANDQENKPENDREIVLIVGASRGLGLGLAREYAMRGARVIGTVRSHTGRTGLHDLADGSAGRVAVEFVDINIPEQVAALRSRLAGQRIGILFLNAGVANGAGETITASSADEFTRLMITNAWSPLRCIEALADLVPPGGVIAGMSSGLGSVANNTRGEWEVYRASKAALNTMLRSFSVRMGGSRTVLAVAPGWVRTDMGGPNAVLDIETSTAGMVDAIAAGRGQPGAAYINYLGQDVAW